MQQSLIDFLRDWLPPQAACVYREMIAADPDGWWRDPHFRGGVIVDAALRGNGITERAIGVQSLDRIWPDLLRRAVEVEQPARRPAARS